MVRNKTLLTVAASLAAIIAVTLSVAQGASTEDDKALRTIVQTLEDGWNAGDSAKFASPFASDADYVIVNGQHIRTRAVIDFGHKQIFGTIYKGSKNKHTIKQIRLLKPDVAIVHVEWNLVYGEKLENKARAMNSIVALKKDGKWEIAAFHNTPIAN
jgi:uncharacterized protein (TIGR02246 family)